MKKIIFFLCTILVCIPVLLWSQTAPEPQYKSIIFPPSSNEKVLNFGARHIPIVDLGGIAYADTTVVNNYFQLLAKNVNPDRVILVVEEEFNEKDKDQIKKTHSVWITQTMEKLGFKSWIPADIRRSSTAVYNHNLSSIAQFANEYYTSKVSYDSIGSFGFPLVKLSIKKPIPDVVADSMILCLSSVVELRDFEENIKRVCDLVKKNGYIPVVIAGFAHVLALGKPCVIMTVGTEQQVLSKVFSELSLIEVENFTKEYFFKK